MLLLGGLGVSGFVLEAKKDKVRRGRSRKMNGHLFCEGRLLEDSALHVPIVGGSGHRKSSW
jgi:hypothetical protein